MFGPSVKLTFTGVFVNDKLQHKDNWLNPVDAYATGADYDASFDDPLRAGRTHTQGIVEFRGAVQAPNAQYVYSSLPILGSGIATSTQFSTSLTDGTSYKVSNGHQSSEGAAVFREGQQSSEGGNSLQRGTAICTGWEVGGGVAGALCKVGGLHPFM